MMAACESTLTHAQVCMPIRGIWGHAPPGKFEFRSSQIASGTRLLFNTCDKTITTTLNFKREAGREEGEGEGRKEGGIPAPPPPLYETLLPLP